MITKQNKNREEIEIRKYYNAKKQKQFIHLCPPIRVYSCKNCSKLGNHCHFEGKLYSMEKDKPFMDFAEIKGIGTYAKPNK